MFKNSLKLVSCVVRHNLMLCRSLSCSTNRVVLGSAKIKHSNNIVFTPVRSLGIKKPKTDDEIKEIVIRVCKEFDKIPTEKFTINSRFVEDFGLDSLDHIELVMAMEDEFEFEIPVEESVKLKTPNDIVVYVNNYWKNYSPVTI